MKKPVIAIGLDAADPLLLETWMSQGYLKNLNQLRQQGIYGRLNNSVSYCGTPTETSATEKLWVTFLTACLPNKTGCWGTVKFYEDTYEVTHDSKKAAYDFKEYPPFYALGDNYRVGVFDVPVTVLSEQVNGLQVLGLGGHAPHTPSHSQPPQLLPELIKQYGKNPLLHQDYGYWWDNTYLTRIHRGLKSSIAGHSAICRDLLQRESWDLFLTVFGETHTVGHDFMHLSQADHPLYPYEKGKRIAGDPLLDAFEEIDRAVGEILAQVSDDACVLVFSVHGMGNNVTDMFSMVFLPELLYRFNFPGKFGLAKGKLRVTPPPLLPTLYGKVGGEVWQQKYDSNPLKRFLRQWTPSKFDKFLGSGQQPDLVSPYQLFKQSPNLHWMPAMWYQPLWSQMQAFALPAFAAGHIRINLHGRERKGIVDISEYESLCNELTQHLYRLKNSRTGEPIVEQVARTRTKQNALDCDPKLPDADLVVIWKESPSDVVDSPDFGRIGPVTYYRSGGHRSQGFLMAKGPGITPGSALPEGGAVDIGPTILELMGASIPKYCDGKPLLKTSVSKLTV